MNIKLVPVRFDESLYALRADDVLILNGASFDFSAIGEGDTLPLLAINSAWFAGQVERTNGELTLSLILPNPWNYSPEQAFPVPLLSVPNGVIQFPQPLPNDPRSESPEPLQFPHEPVAGEIDWSLLITAEMKAAASAAAQLAEAKAMLAAKNAKAVLQIARIQDRVNTLGYGIDAGDATEADEAEQAALLINLKAWKTYKFALGKVTGQATWPGAPVWPLEPAMPDIPADPGALATETQ